MTADTEVLDAVQRRCRRYRGCGLPAQVAGPDQVVLRVDNRIDAVTTPAEFGGRVLELLLKTSCAGPVVEHLRHRWIFLTGHETGLSTDRLVKLAEIRVSVATHGDLVVLPSPASEVTRLWRWVRWPNRADLPPLSTVLDAVSWVSRAVAVG